jgi:hypothetical protein
MSDSERLISRAPTAASRWSTLVVSTIDAASQFLCSSLASGICAIDTSRLAASSPVRLPCDGILERDIVAPVEPVETTAGTGQMT